MAGEGTVTTRPRAQSFIIKRPRLTKLLDESEARIILLVAPAGYGKTTLAREWLEGREGVLWYSGRPAMADVAALAAGLVNAFAADDEVRERALERVQILATRGQSPEALAKAVVSAIPPTASTLVIDDCHLAASPESEALLAALTLDTPLRVALVSRTRPAWVTSRMLVYGEASALEMADLAFSDDEARSVIGNGPRATSAGLLSTAQGWPAVIGLAAQRGSAELRGTLRLDDLYGFFAEDLFRRADPEMQEALIFLALGGDTNTTVAAGLLGQSCEVTLATAWEHGFLGPDASRLEIHPLLRAFLLERLRDLSPRRAEEIVRATVNALAANDLWDECLAALQQFPLADIIASALEGSLADLLNAGRISTVTRWVELAHANGVSTPMLLLAEAEIALRDRDDRRAQILGGRAGDLLQGDAAGRAYVVAARAAHFAENAEDVTKYAELAFSSTASTELQTAAQWIEFSSAVQHSPGVAGEILDRLTALPDQRPEHALRILNAEGVLLMNTDGDVRTAVEKCELASAVMHHVRDPFVTTGFLNLFSAAAAALAQYDQALALSHTMLVEARATGLDFVVDHALIVRTNALIGLRRLTEAQRSLNEVRRRANLVSPHIVGNVHLQEIMLRIAAGDLNGASLLIQREQPSALPPRFFGEFLALRGLVFATLGDRRAAEDAAEAALQVLGWVGTSFLANVALAIPQLHRSEQGAETRCIELLMWAYERGHMDAMVTAVRACPELARVGARNDECARALTEVLSASSDVDIGRRAGLQMPRILGRREQLSPREWDVYELMMQGRSNKEIAKTLFISESTTKVHVRHIYDKVGVHSRAQLARTPLDERVP